MLVLICLLKKWKLELNQTSVMIFPQRPFGLYFKPGCSGVSFAVKSKNQTSHFVRQLWASMNISCARSAKSLVENSESCSLILRILLENIQLCHIHY